MLKKINKQRDKIEKLISKEADAAEKLTALQEELAGERDALDEMEKEYLFTMMRGKELSLEDTILLLEGGMQQGLEEIEQEKAEVTEPDAEADFKNASEDFELEIDDTASDKETEMDDLSEIEPDFVSESEEGFFSRFGRKDHSDTEDFWK